QQRQARSDPSSHGMLPSSSVGASRTRGIDYGGSARPRVSTERGNSGDPAHGFRGGGRRFLAGRRFTLPRKLTRRGKRGAPGEERRTGDTAAPQEPMQWKRVLCCPFER